MPEATHIPASLTLDSLKQPAQIGKRLLEPFKTFADEHKLPIQILEDTTIINRGEVHEHEADLFICLGGEVTFTCEGRLAGHLIEKDGTTTGDTVDGGADYVLKAGDMLFIPPHVPHTHRTDTTAQLYIVKIPQQSIA